MRHVSLLVLFLCSTSLFAQTTTYRWIDPASGRTMITDTPPPRNAKLIGKSGSAETESNPMSAATRRAAENFPVILYTSADCVAECKSARDLLNKRGVPYTEKMVQKPEDVAELKALVGDVFVPSIKVGKQSNRGYQAEAYNNLLDLAGYPATAPYGSKPASPLAQ